MGEIEVQPDVAQNGLGFTDGRPRIWTTVGLRIEPLCVKKVIFNEFQIAIETQDLVVDEPFFA